MRLWVPYCSIVIGIMFMPARIDHAAVASERPSAVFMQMAQSGSTGGSIGKQRKSASGSDEPATPKAAPEPKQRRVSTRSQESKSGSRKSNACGQMGGTWTANGWWNMIYGRGDVVLNSNGTARHNSGIVGSWTCTGNHFVMDWKDWAHGEGTVSSDGNTITFGDGNTMTRGH